jgi:tRNA threonylcarbamoyladenosine biosynthesis protein TsaE
MISLTLNDTAATDRFGAMLAQRLPPGTVVALEGTLGAGKTRLVQAVAAALGIPVDAVTSPTFVLIHEYLQGRIPLYHFDAYRLRDEDEFLQLGPEEYFEGGGLTMVEWADRIAALLPEEHAIIALHVTGQTSRRATMRGTTERISRLCEEIDEGLRNQ